MTTLALPQLAFDLDDIRIAAPCDADWQAMTPVDDAGRVRDEEMVDVQGEELVDDRACRGIGADGEDRGSHDASHEGGVVFEPADITVTVSGS